MNNNHEIIESLRNNAYVKEKDCGNNVHSFNFTRKAFYKKVWNAQTVRARGLFVNVNTDEIVARSYNKFFNLGEMEDADVTLAKLAYPVRCYVKENGYLAMCSWDRGNDCLFVASKSSTSGWFAGRARELIVATLSEEAIDYLKNHNVTMIFEVIDPVNDPHIIRYEEAHAVLLDIVDNQFDCNFMDDDEVNAVSCAFNDHGTKYTHRKILFTVCASENALRDVLHQIDDTCTDLEGLVIVDNRGFRVKFKSAYYRFWKLVRGAVGNAQKVRERFDLADRDYYRRALAWLESEAGMDAVSKCMISENRLNVVRLANVFESTALGTRP